MNHVRIVLYTLRVLFSCFFKWIPYCSGSSSAASYCIYFSSDGDPTAATVAQYNSTVCIPVQVLVVLIAFTDSCSSINISINPSLGRSSGGDDDTPPRLGVAGMHGVRGAPLGRVCRHRDARTLALLCIMYLYRSAVGNCPLCGVEMDSRLQFLFLLVVVFLLVSRHGCMSCL